MSWLRVADALKAQVGSPVTVKGWVRTRRDSKADGGLSFVEVHDGSCFGSIQIVARAGLPNYASEVAKLGPGCSVEIGGKLVASQGKGQAVEIVADAVRVDGWVENPDQYPVAKKGHTFEYLREVAHLRARTNTFGAVARVRHCLAMAIHRFMHERGFYWVHTPIITGSDCEGAGQMFRVSTLDMVNLPRTGGGAKPPAGGAPGGAGAIDWSQDFFGKESHLTVSGQLNVETYCCALSKVYTFGPTFRAENSNTSRHLAEFWMIEPEIAFCDLMGDSVLAEDMLKYLFSAVLTERADDMAFFNERIEKGVVDRLKGIIEKPFRRLPYTEAISILENAIAGGKKFEFPVKWGSDLQSEHERFLTEEHFKQPVIPWTIPRA
jgi:asparaginyl-tRNA synthetase